MRYTYSEYVPETHQGRRFQEHVEATLDETIDVIVSFLDVDDGVDTIEEIFQGLIDSRGREVAEHVRDEIRLETGYDIIRGTLLMGYETY